jgi:TPR repeat protein
MLQITRCQNYHGIIRSFSCHRLALPFVLLLFTQPCGFGRDVAAVGSTTLNDSSKQAVSTAAKIETAEKLYAQGRAFEEGNGAARDERKAAELYRRAADQGYPPAQHNLALLYEQGRGVEQNLATAAKWYQAAAKQGDAEAQNNLGRLYALGHGVPQDALQAAYWYHKAAEQGNVEGENNLANCYREGRGVRQDRAKAFALYQKAAMAGYAAAQNNLGLMYANGTGTERDYCLAYAWLSVATGALPASQKLLQQVESRMTSEQVIRARHQLDELQARLVSRTNEGIDR